MTKLAEKIEADYFRCVESEHPLFTVGAVYEVHSYVDGEPRVATDNQRVTLILPVETAAFEPHDPWAYLRAREARP